jgi:ABC transport system ATP-binding/permease protein
MALIGVHNLTKYFGPKLLFEGLTFSINEGERIGVIGPNGAGKSTLFKILSGEMDHDSGNVSVQRGLKRGFVEQVPAFASDATIESTVGERLGSGGDRRKIQEMISRLELSQFSPDTRVAELSGGWRKRVALARELCPEPGLLFLDEPTNHLDVESILWLEKFLSRSPCATVTITHDRLFLQRIAARIIEIDRRHPDGMLSVDGDYAHFLEVRADLLGAQQLQEEKLRNTLRRETEWLRRGAKARQAKQTARQNAAHDLADEVGDLTSRNRVREVKFDFSTTQKTPKKLIEAKGIEKSFNGQIVIPKLDLVIAHKARIGLMGVNGCGKSTLIQLLTKALPPDSGEVHHAERVQISYFDQTRESLDPQLTVLKTICPLGEKVDFAGGSVHVRSYLARFLFGYDQMERGVGSLSGGEQSRLLLARLMLKEANLLILDEPTNDLDLATLDSLCEVLSEFPGAIVLVSHDRYFLDQLTTQILAFGINSKGDPSLAKLVGIEQWEEWHREQLNWRSSLSRGSRAMPVERPKKMNFQLQQELIQIPKLIEKAETRLQELLEQNSAGSEKLAGSALLEYSRLLAEVQSEIERLYERWVELEGPS